MYLAFHPWLRHLPPRGLRPLLRWALRTPVKRWVRRDFGDGARRVVYFTGGFKHGMAPGDYACLLADSRIVLCPKGFCSAETFRHVEALRAGAVVVSERLPDTLFYRDGPFVIVDDWRDGLRQVEALLADPVALSAAHAAGLAWYDAVLSERAVADYVARSLESLGDAARARGLSNSDAVL